MGKDGDTIAQAIRYTFAIVGVTPDKVPHGELEDVLFDFITTYYPSLKPAEIKEAFSLAAKQAFEVNIQLYDRMYSPELFGRVIAEYKKFKAKQNAQPKAVVTPDKPLAVNMPKMTPEQSFKNICQYIEKEGKLPMAWDWDNVFSHCEATGLISDTNEEKQMFMDAEVEKLRIEQKQAELAKSSLANSIKSTLEKPASIKQHCRRERVIVFLKSKYGI